MTHIGNKEKHQEKSKKSKQKIQTERVDPGESTDYQLRFLATGFETVEQVTRRKRNDRCLQLGELQI